MGKAVQETIQKSVSNQEVASDCLQTIKNYTFEQCQQAVEEYREQVVLLFIPIMTVDVFFLQNKNDKKVQSDFNHTYI